MFIPRRISAAGLLLVLGTACADQSPVSPRRSSMTPAARSNDVSSAWATEISGEIGDGAEYGIFVPPNWNGDVVFYAHGIVPPLAPVSLPGPADWDDAGALRDA